MSISWKIPRNCLAWLLVAQVFLVLPHIKRLPLWVLATCFICACWRVLVFQGRWSFPHRWLKVVLAVACFTGIFNSYGTVIGLESMVALLITGFSLKLLEVADKRDVYVIIFLGYFVALTEFLFSQDFMITCLVFVSVVLISTSLVALHQQRYDQLNLTSLRTSGILFLQAIPLMVVLFIVFPRIGPLWSVPQPASQATTGISDTMSPGDISKLTQSGELVFRASFDGDVPKVEQLYWRGLVLSEFDGRSWHQGERYNASSTNGGVDNVPRRVDSPVRYSITQEATHQPWLFTLALAISQTQGIVMTPDFRLARTKPIRSRILYDVISDTGAVLELDLTEQAHRYESYLPPGNNPESRHFARKLYRLSRNDQEYVQKVLEYFREQPFSYTLKPPLLGENTVDEFLFSTRRGFCSHYASSFVFLMRSVGIASRIVAGYQGGEINPISGAVLVHQFDAHAWAEVWHEGEGWIRVDPTAVVSPARIEWGLQNALAGERSFLSEQLLSPVRYRHVNWINQFRLRVDALSYYWQTAVLQYRGDRQIRLIERLIGEVSAWRVAGFILGVGLLVFSVVAVVLFRGRVQRSQPPWVKAYLRLCARLERAGFARASQEGAIDYARRMAEQDQVFAKHLMLATRAFVSLCYEPVDSEQKKTLLKQLRKESLKVSYLLRVK